MSPRNVWARFLALGLATALASANPLVIGHRGAGSDSSSRPFPENSLPSILAAFEVGADIVEIDVQLAKDGTPILWHDDTVPVGGEKVRTNTLMPDEFPVLQGPTGVITHVPTLREALRVALDHGPAQKVLDIELKVVDSAARNPLCDAVARVLRQERAARRVMISTFDKKAIVRLEATLPGIETGLLGVFKGSTLGAAKKLVADGTPVEWVIPSKWAPFALEGKAPAAIQARADAERAEAAAAGIPLLEAPAATGSVLGKLKAELLSESRFVRKAHAAGFKAGVWTANKAKDLEGLAADGFDMIITDEPGLARSLFPAAASGQAE